MSVGQRISLKAHPEKAPELISSGYQRAFGTKLSSGSLSAEVGTAMLRHLNHHQALQAVRNVEHAELSPSCRLEIQAEGEPRLPDYMLDPWRPLLGLNK